jgi:hypothetical protein
MHCGLAATLFAALLPDAPPRDAGTAQAASRVSRLAAVKHSAAIRPVFTVLIAFPMVPLIKWRQNKQRVPLIGGFSRRGFWHSIGLIVL